MTKFYNNLAGKVKLVKRHYFGDTMDFAKLPAEPYSLLSAWLEEALGNNRIKEPNAMCLTTASPDGRPHSRMVLLKNVYPEPAAEQPVGGGQADGLAQAAEPTDGAVRMGGDKPPARAGQAGAPQERESELAAGQAGDASLAEGGQAGSASQPAGLVFFSNYDSDKGKQIAANPKVALALWWPPLYKQVRVEGEAHKLAAELSDEYFASRDRGSQIGAWASPQSGRLDDYRELQQRMAEAEAKFKGREVPRPPHWGGYLVVPQRVEFWEGRLSRLHYRVVYQKRGGANQAGWDKFMLAP